MNQPVKLSPPRTDLIDDLISDHNKQVSGDIPAEIKDRLAKTLPEAWVQSFALLLASGSCSIEAAAQRLGKPVRVLTNLLKLTEFTELVQSLAGEMKKDVAVDLLRSCGVDSVLFLVRTMQDERHLIKDRITCAQTLLKYRMSERLIGEMKKNSEITDTISKHGNLEKGINAELQRLLTNNKQALQAEGLLCGQDTKPTSTTETRGFQGTLPRLQPGTPTPTGLVAASAPTSGVA